MADERDGKDEQAQESTPTKHGRWTPEVSQAADREMRELARDEDMGTTPATGAVDKSHLGVPDEQHPADAPRPEES